MSSPSTLIPRKLLFGNPDRSQVVYSPDGRWLSYLSSVQGVLNLFVAPADDLASAVPVTQDQGRGVRFYLWAYDSAHVLYLQDKDGDENWHIHCVEVATRAVRDLTPFDGARAVPQQLSPLFPDEILIGINDRLPQVNDLYRLNLRTGERTLVIHNEEGFVQYMTDYQFNVRLGMRLEADGTTRVLRRNGDTWEPAFDIPHEDSLTTQPYTFALDGETLYMADSRGRDTSALYSVNVNTGAQTLIAEDARADLDQVLLHPTEFRAQAAAFTYDRRRWQVIDPAIQADLDFLATVADGEIEITSRTQDDARWIVAYTMDDGPTRYYAYDRTARQAQFLFSNRQGLEGQPLSRMHSAVVTARDGLPLVCYYSLPLGSDAAQPGRPAQPLPMVLLVHGGPWYRDFWGYDSTHQWLTNRGYAVMSVNFRGSTGFGKAFVNAGDLEWGRAMHHDLLDAVAWAVEQGIAAPDQVAIMGGSYGGYATLAGLTMTPEVFACGVDIVGPSNLMTLIESVPPYWEPMIALFRKRMGDNLTEDGRDLLRARSPLTHVRSIRRPLLIAQGANDPRVKQAESDQIVSAMQANGIPVTYALYPDEGHGFARPENNLSFTAIAEAFLATHLEGACEPVGDDFQGSSITLPVGAEYLPNGSALPA